MDPLSQGLLGAGLAVLFARKKQMRLAALCGALGGMAPDLDILIRSQTDPLLAIEYHRHFTHSLAFIPIGGALVALILWGLLRLFKRAHPFARLYLFATLGWATHGFLDACTSYGTRLYWPFSNVRESWNIVSIIDPIFTLPLLLLLSIALIRKSPQWARAAMALCLSYLLIGSVQHRRVEHFVQQVAEQRQHTVERILLNPTIGNTILWRSVYQSGGRYYVDAVYAPPFASPKLHVGESVAVIDPETIFPALPAHSTQRGDIKRFAYFSQGFVYVDARHANTLADVRYGTLPHDLNSMWGLTIAPDAPHTHAQFRTLRQIDDTHYATFWRMLRGESPSQELVQR